MTFSGTGLPVSLESDPADIYIYTTSKLQLKQKKKKKKQKMRCTQNLVPLATAKLESNLMINSNQYIMHLYKIFNFIKENQFQKYKIQNVPA